jgi:hypothetical protein
VVREKVLESIRAICLALPETSERLSHGAPTFFVREKRAFLMVLTNHHGDGRFAIWCAPPEGVQQLLTEADPEKFFVPPYVGHRGGSASGSTVVLTGTSWRGLPRTPTPRSRLPSSSRLHSRLADCSKSHFRHKFALDKPRRLNRVSDTWLWGPVPDGLC